jgi:hypothetical protein
MNDLPPRSAAAQALHDALTKIYESGAALLGHDDDLLRKNCAMAWTILGLEKLEPKERHGVLQLAILQSTPEDRAAFIRWMVAEGFIR